MAVDNIARALAGKALNTENINKKSDVGQECWSGSYCQICR